MSEFSISDDELPISETVEHKQDEALSGETAPESNIAQQFSDSLIALRELIAGLVRQPKETSQPEALISKALEKYSRLNTWGEETRAALPADSRGSLDHTIRKDAALKDMVMSILKKVERQAMNATRIAQSRPEESVVDDDEDDDTESSSGSEDHDWSVEAGHTSKKPPTWHILRQIEEDIRSLFQISFLVKRPGFTRQYVHSTNQTKWDRRVEHYVEFDRNYVQEKLLDWNSTPKRQEEEQIATPELLSERVSISGSLASLMERISRANTKRREQLFYWSKHPDQNPAAVGSEPRITKAKSVQGSEDNKRDGMKQKRPKDEGDTTKSEYGKSMMSKQTFSTRVVSDKLGAMTVAGPARTIYAESTTGRRMSNRVPEVPSTSLRQKAFECPYCHLELNSVLMRNRQEWKRHVFRDLRPYLCTFIDCQTPDKQYQSRHDWIYHEMQMHRRRWVCEEHNTDFSTADDFIGHLTTAHASTVTQQQIPTLVEISERPCDDLEVCRCPLCPDTRKLTTLRTHLAGHLESMSLFALSGTYAAHDDDLAEEDEEEEKDSDIAAGGTQSSDDGASDVSELGQQVPIENEEFTALKTKLGLGDVALASFHQQLHSLQAGRAPGTFEWILDNPRYQNWFGPGEPNIAWLFGTPKSGKSTMASFIASHVVNTRGLCVYYPIDTEDEKMFNLPRILRVLWLMTLRQAPELQSRVANTVNTFIIPDLKAVDIEWDSLFTPIFESTSKKTIYWIIDKIEKSERLDLFLNLLLAINTSKVPIKVLLVGQYTTDIEEAFEVIPDVVPFFMLKA